MAEITTDFAVADDFHESEVEAVEKRETKRRICHSNYFILVNSNKRYQKGQRAEAAANEMKAALGEVFSKDKIPGYIHINKKKLPDDEYNPKLFKTIEVKGTVELGPTTHCIHAHVLLAIAHYTCMKLDYDSIEAGLKKELGDGIYVEFQFVRDKMENFKRYINKDVAAPPVRERGGGSGASVKELNV